MIQYIKSASTTVALKVKAGETSVVFGEQNLITDKKITGILRIDGGAVLGSNAFYPGELLTLKIGNKNHIEKLPTYMIVPGGSDTFSIVSEKPVNWADSFIQWKNAAPIDAVICFLVFYEDTK